MKNLPIYKLRIKESDTNELQVEAIALVDEPAILVNWQMFEKQIKFYVDKERQMVIAPVMLADFPIYRRDEKFGEHYVVFDKEEIYKIVQKFRRNNLDSSFNLMHDKDKKVEGVYVLETFIMDYRGILPPEVFRDVPLGSWFITVKIDNRVIWDEFIKTGKLKAFSVEGMFKYEYSEKISQSEIDEIISIVENINK